MFARIIVGIIIGLVSGFVLNGKFENKDNVKNIALVFLALVIIAFIGSSFMFGAVYGAMAVGEIALGYYFSSSVSKKESK